MTRVKREEGEGHRGTRGGKGPRGGEGQRGRRGGTEGRDKGEGGEGQRAEGRDIGQRGGTEGREGEGGEGRGKAERRGLIFQGTCTGTKIPLLKTERFTECAQLEVRHHTHQPNHTPYPHPPPHMYISLYTIPKYTQHMHTLNHHIKILCVEGGGGGGTGLIKYGQLL